MLFKLSLPFALQLHSNYTPITLHTQIPVTMATLKTCVKNDFVKTDGKSNIKIRISHDGKVRYLKTPYYIESDLLGKDGRVKRRHPNYIEFNAALTKLITEYESIIVSIGPDIQYLAITTLMNMLRKNESNGASFLCYANKRIEEFKEEGRNSYAASYQSSNRWLTEFTNTGDILFKEINYEFLEKFQRHLKKNNRKVNTIRIYLNNIKAIFNYAIDNNVIRPELYPFRKFHIKREKTGYKDLTIDEMRKLQFGPYTKAQQKAFDIFMLSFYLIGINMKDLLYLKKENIIRGRIVYRRFKTEKKVEDRISVKITPIALQIFEQYKGQKYLLDYLDEDDGYSHFKTVTHNINDRLALIGKSYGILELTTYSARYTWSTIASSIGILQDSISHALGHVRNATTEGYINYDLNLIDIANLKIIEAISCNASINMTQKYARILDSTIGQEMNQLAKKLK
jgi:integrase